MSDLTIGVLSALLATNPPQAVSNLVQQETGVSVDIPTNPTERQLRQIMMADDTVLDEVNDWIHTNTIPRSDTNALLALDHHIREDIDGVRRQYDFFLQSHPDSARGHLAYGTFLNDIHEEEKAMVEYENARQLDPANAAVWNNLANYYGEFSPVTKAFKYYAEAIRLAPNEPVYYENLATTIYLYRKDAREYYQITEPEVFDKALDLYRQAIRLAPRNFLLATHYAESYYGIKPLRTHDALAAWTNALQTAHTDFEREGVHLHLARVKTQAGLYDEARAHLTLVTNSTYADLRRVLEKNLTAKEHPAPPAK